MKKHLLITITALAFTAGSFFVFANAGTSEKSDESCCEISDEDCCEEECDPSTCEYDESACKPE
ncbi:MAG TPA: hypothetical protein DIW47_05545 [Bacteroidetes bacterium]|nr:hypothetical protein [Bacteroidota bacterium]